MNSIYRVFQSSNSESLYRLGDNRVVWIGKEWIESYRTSVETKRRDGWDLIDDHYIIDLYNRLDILMNYEQ